MSSIKYCFRFFYFISTIPTSLFLLSENTFSLFSLKFFLENSMEPMNVHSSGVVVGRQKRRRHRAGEPNLSFLKIESTFHTLFLR